MLENSDTKRGLELRQVVKDMFSVLSQPLQSSLRLIRRSRPRATRRLSTGGRLRDLRPTRRSFGASR